MIRSLSIIALLTVSGSALAFNEDACGQGQAGEHNPHCTAQVNAVPEPGTAALLGVGLLAIALARRVRNLASK